MVLDNHCEQLMVPLENLPTWDNVGRKKKQWRLFERSGGLSSSHAAAESSGSH